MNGEVIVVVVFGWEKYILLEENGVDLFGWMWKGSYYYLDGVGYRCMYQCIET